MFFMNLVMVWYFRNFLIRPVSILEFIVSFFVIFINNIKDSL